MKNVSESVKSREEEFSVRDAIMQEQWKKEDDRQHLLRDQRTRQLKAFEEEARMAGLQEDLTLRMQRLQLERDAKVLYTTIICAFYQLSTSGLAVDGAVFGLCNSFLLLSVDFWLLVYGASIVPTAFAAGG